MLTVALALSFGLAAQTVTAQTAPAPVATPASAMSNSNAAAPASALDRVIQSKVLRVCTTGDYKPFSFLNPDTKTYEGIDIDMAASLATSLGAAPQFVASKWSTLLDDLGAGKCDIVMGGVSINLTRQARAFFSSPEITAGKAAIARCADKARFASLDAIDQPGVRVIVNPGGTNEAFAKANIRRATIVAFPTNVGIFDEIAAGRADVMMTDSVETLLQQKLNPKLCAVNPDAPFTYAELGYMLPRGDSVFKAYVDQWLHLAQKTGEYGRAFDKFLK